MIEVHGLDRVQANLRRLREEWPREGQRILSEVGKPLLGEARSRARVDTGRMRASIRQATTVDMTEVFSDVAHARFQNYGTVYVTPNPFLTGALHDQEPRIVSDFDKLAWRYIIRMWVDS